MSRPTDKALEEMAARLEDGGVCSPAQNSCRNGYLMLGAAAMLRACKGQPAPDHSEWNAAIEAAIVNLKVYPLHQEDAGPEHDIGYAAGYRTALNRVSALKKGPDQWLSIKPSQITGRCE